MKLLLLRERSTAACTFGRLFVDGALECQTLEDVMRPVKVKGVTAIPAGTYEIILNYSNSFGRQLPLLLNTPNFVGVRIHSGNTAADSEGCILVGRARAKDSVVESRKAFAALFKKIQAAAQREKVKIEIVDPK